jgi:nitronate monooxygenase
MEQLIKTRFTERFGIAHPVVLAPMDLVAGGRLAAAVSAAGGLGLIGGGYGDADWLDAAFREAGNQRVGVGFITWSLMQQPALIERALAHKPAAFMVSFGDGEAAVAAARAAGVPTMWQVQRLAHARQALAAKADVIVVQGQEAGGHGMDRGLTALLPAVRDLAGPDQCLLAAGGMADGRGLASALMLGADGVMLGTRFWASAEADGSDAAKSVLVRATGDDTVRSKVFDVARGRDWPWHFTGRVVANEFCRQWHDDIDGLKRAIDAERVRYNNAGEEDFSVRVTIAGESVDLIQSVEPAETIVHEVVGAAARLMQDARAYLI